VDSHSRTGANSSSDDPPRVSRLEEQANPQAARSEAPTSVKEPLCLVHHHPGYLRVRAVAFLQPDSPIAAAARTAAEEVSGFRSWSLNPKTGSVVIQYDPGTLDSDDLLKHIAKRAGFRGVEIATRRKMTRQELVSGFLDTVQDINQVVDQLTGGRADLREVGPVALAALSVVSFVVNDDRGRLPFWSNALYHSYRVFMHWHRPETRTRERIARQAEERGQSADVSIDS